MRQAIVIVHGMGEQRPTQTLRSFAKAALPGREDGISEPYFSRPDRVGDELEQRVFVAPEHPAPIALPRSYPDGFIGPTRFRQDQADLYEYHWAHLMEGNKLTALLPTIRKVMFGNPIARTWNLFLLLWGLVAVLAWFGWENRETIQALLASDEGADPLSVFVGILGLSGVFAAAAVLLVKLVSGWVQSSFVDVARYLDTAPGNLEARRKIHSGLADYLEGLHKQRIFGNQPRYERIIVVAHSLGSYIAYDAITFLWARMNTTRDRSAQTTQPCLQYLEELAQDGKAGTEEYWDAQLALWREYQSVGNGWRISDLITLGSPMSLAHRLLAKSRGRLHADQIASREMPSSPPVSEVSPPSARPRANAKKWFSWEPSDRGNVRVLHHAAPFAVTRWTNYWFRPYLGFFGDWFGGPVVPNFGAGIKDVPISMWSNGRWKQPKAWLQLVPAAPHAWYFKWHKYPDEGGAVATLREALDLDFESKLNEPIADVKKKCAGATSAAVPTAAASTGTAGSTASGDANG